LAGPFFARLPRVQHIAICETFDAESHGMCPSQLAIKVAFRLGWAYFPDPLPAGSSRLAALYSSERFARGVSISVQGKMPVTCTANGLSTRQIYALTCPTNLD